MRAFVLINFFLLPSYLFSQISIDSLKSKLSSTSDTLQVNVLNKLAEEFRYKDFDTVRYYASKARVLSEKLNYQKGLAQALCFLGVSHASQNNHAEASKFFEQSLATIPPGEQTLKVRLLNVIASNQAEPAFKFRYLSEAIKLAKEIEYPKIGSLYHNLANWYYHQSKYKDAFQYYVLGTKEAEKRKDSISMLVNLDGMGSVLDAQGDERTFSYKMKALKIAEKLNHTMYIAWIKCHLVTYYRKKNELDTAIALGLETIELAKQSGDFYTVSNVLSEMGSAYKERNEVPKAIECYKKGLEYLENLSEAPKLKVSLLTRMGEAYNSIGNYKEAIPYLKEAIAKGKLISAKSDLAPAYLELSKAYYNSSNFKEAYKFHYEYTLLKDSIYGLENKKQIAALNNQYQVEKKDQAIKILTQNNKIKDLQLSHSKTQFILLLVFCLFALAMIALLYNRYRVKAKANKIISKANKMMEEANLKILESMEEKEVLLQEIHHRVKNNLQMISSLLKWQSESVKDKQLLKIIGEGRSRIKSVALIHELLYQSDNLANINVDSYFDSLLNYISSLYIKNNKIVIYRKIEPIHMDIDTIIPVGLIVTELVTNAFKYAFPDEREGKIQVLLSQKDNDVFHLEIKDNGIGLPYELTFLQTPSTTMGLQLVRTLSKQLKGKLSICNEGGTSFSIHFSNLHYKEPIEIVSLIS